MLDPHLGWKCVPLTVTSDDLPALGDRRVELPFFVRDVMRAMEAEYCNPAYRGVFAVDAELAHDASGARCYNEPQNCGECLWGEAGRSCFQAVLSHQHNTLTQPFPIPPNRSRRWLASLPSSRTRAESAR